MNSTLSPTSILPKDINDEDVQSLNPSIIVVSILSLVIIIAFIAIKWKLLRKKCSSSDKKSKVTEENLDLIDKNMESTISSFCSELASKLGDKFEMFISMLDHPAVDESQDPNKFLC